MGVIACSNLLRTKKIDVANARKVLCTSAKIILTTYLHAEALLINICEELRSIRHRTFLQINRSIYEVVKHN